MDNKNIYFNSDRSYYANETISARNITVSPGDKIPPGFQTKGGLKYLLDHYGFDSVVEKVTHNKTGKVTWVTFSKKGAEVKKDFSFKGEKKKAKAKAPEKKKSK